jgi:hypothetical protein
MVPPFGCSVIKSVVLEIHECKQQHILEKYFPG